MHLKVKIFQILALAGLATPSLAGHCHEDSPIARTKNGTLCGVHLPSFAQNAFLGVPFAQPPVNDLRLRHPVPYNRRYKAYPATSQPANCPGYARFDVGIGPLSEDCLYLNVIVPDNTSPHESLPVLVWIYGGGFTAGGVADPRYNMSYIVQQSAAIGKPIIGVSINYRVAGWGFLASREVLAAGVANIGLYDQRLALRWIRENIAGFGGDAKKVTIWGESAGAFSVGYHLVGFDGENEGLFRAAIMDSGTMLGPALQDAKLIAGEDGFQAMYDNVTETVGCKGAEDTLACLRTVPYEVLFEAFEPQIYTPVIDGAFITRKPSEALALGKVADVAVLVGANTDEGTASFWGPRGTLNTTADVAAYIRTLNGGGLSDDEVAELLALYPDDPAQGCPYGTGVERFASQGWMYKRGAAIAGDIFVHAGRRGLVEYYARKNNAKDKRRQKPVYSYRFDQPPWNGVLELIATVPPVYSTHYAELIFVFNNPSQNLSNYIGPYPSYHELSEFMSRFWASFVHDLDPNGHAVDGAPYWPQYKLSQPQNIVFRTVNMSNGNGSYVEEDTYRKDQLKWWNAHWSSLRC
ncbi:lipase 4 [Aspergillus udagawae]|uniref:Carboxylic ester hydrolase n=1 Tax=Aspergillus udagawae TaxID=91492 RepID=A0ABQ1A7X9_9EURO|nr:lipase 4 [Aspergillus udagawae]GFG18688.1 lipase 4 [Aspergillus udagawae]